MESDNKKNRNKTLQDGTTPESGNTELPKGTVGSTKNNPTKPPVTIDLKSDQVKSKTSAESNEKKEAAAADSKNNSAKNKSSQKSSDKSTESTGFGSPESSTSKQSENSKALKSDSNSKKSTSDRQNDLATENQNSQLIRGRIMSSVVAGAVGGLLVLSIMYVVSLFDSNSTESISRIESIEAVNLEDDGRLTALESQTSLIGARLNDFFNESNEESELVKLSNSLVLYEEQLNGYGKQLSTALEKLNNIDSSGSFDSDTAQELRQSLTEIEGKIEEDRTKIESIELLFSDQQTSVSQLISQGDALKEQLADVQKLLESLASKSADVSVATSRITDLTARVSNVEKEIEKSSPRELASRTIAVMALKSAVDNGESFSVELDVVRSMFPENEELQKIAEQSEEGISTIPELIAIFPEIARKMDAESQKSDEDSGVVNSILTGVRSLVVIRNSDVDESSDVSSLIFAMRKSVEKADFEKALAIYELLPQNIQQHATKWVDSVMIRLEVDGLVNKVTANVIKSMSDSLN